MEPELFEEEGRGAGGGPQRAAPPPERGGDREEAAFHRVSKRVNAVADRLGVVEERLANLRRKEGLTEQSLLDFEREARSELRALTSRLTELSRAITELKEAVGAMRSELEGVVKKPDFLVLQHYLDLWEPVRFVTRDEARLLLEEARARAEKGSGKPVE